MSTNKSRAIRHATGFFLKKLRDESGLSQELCGNFIGLSQSQYSKIERGEQPIEIESALKLVSGILAHIRP